MTPVSTMRRSSLPIRLIRPSPNDNFTVTLFEKYFHRPAAIYHVAGHVILIYRTNLLTHLAPGQP